MSTLLFVYGTMMRLGRNYTRLLQHGAIGISDYGFLTEDPFDLYLRPDRTPVAIRNWDTGLPVSGEVYVLPDGGIESIDKMKGHLVRREEVIIKDFNDRNDLHVYMYVYPGEAPEGADRIIPNDGFLEYDPNQTI